MNLVELKTLTFENELSRNRDSNVKFAPLVAGEPAEIALIVAMAMNGVIGRDGRLPWRLSTDLKLFRRHTMGKPLIMGRKTYASLNGPLDGRDMIVVTRDPAFTAPGVVVAHSLSDALARGQELALARATREIMVIGGAEIFREALSLAARIYLTRVLADIPGDVRFPEVDWSGWRKVRAERFEKGARDEFPFTFSTLQRSR